MAQVQLRDQNGKPVPGLAVRLAFRGEPTEKALFEQIADQAGATDFGYAAAGIIAINANAKPGQQWTLHINKNEAFNPNWKTIESKTVDVPGVGVGAFQQDVVVILQVQNTPEPPQPPTLPLTTITGPNAAKGHGTVQEWKAIAHAVVAEKGLTVMNQAQLGAFEAGMKAHDPLAELQRDSSGNFKPRFFAVSLDRSDNAESGKFSRPCDFGDFGKPFFSGAGGTDEWVPTGRPANTQW